jgi:hypothetical protein
MARLKLQRLDIEQIDTWPREARQAICDSVLLGNGHPQFRIARTKGAVMAERIRRADARLCTGNNMERHATCTLAELNAILCGQE